MKTKLLLLAFSLCAVLSSAQTAVQLLPSPKMQFMDPTGTVPLALGKVCTYQAGTTTPLATYTDSTGTVQNTNPVILDVAGRAQIWWGTAAYKVTLLTAGTDSTCSTGSQVWSIDNVSQKYFRLDGSNVLTAIPDPSVALGEFWLSSTLTGRLKWSDASAIHTIVGADTTDTLTGKTYDTAGSGNSFLINGLAATANIGTGAVVRQSAPSFTGTVNSAGLINANLGATVTGGALTALRSDYPRQAVTLANGANNDIALNGATFAKISGPTGVFSISGFTGGEDGRVLYFFNSAAFAMTITNQGAGSAAANRITTLTGADVTLRAGPSFATFIYDSAATAWILVSTN